MSQALFQTDDAAVADRSTLQAYAECPLQGWNMTHGTVSGGGDLAAVGDECHAIISAAVRDRATSGTPASELREFIEGAAVRSRPDLQPKVIVAMRRAAWPISQMLCYRGDGHERHPDDLICYDGGDEKRSGQLAADIQVGEQSLRVTSELDLLIATSSAAEVDEIDWKSGWRWWTPGDVEDAFQFQCHAWLIFYNFPAVSRVNISVYMTAAATLTSPVTFDRDRDMYRIGKRLESAAATYLKWHDAKVDDVPALPLPSKCAICDAAAICQYSHKPAGAVAIDPKGYLRQYAAIQATADAMKANLTAYVRKRGGGDLEVDGIAFGVNRPKQNRAPTMDLYEVGGKGEPTHT